MAAEVSSLIRLINGSDSNESALAGKSTALITRDFLGGCSALDSKELDLDLQVPSGCEKRLDLKSGNVYLEKRNSSNLSSSTSENIAKRQDLNFPPVLLNPFDDAALDLKLVLSSSAPSMKSPNYQSVCTLDKVKSALERVEKESSRKRSTSLSKSSPPHSNSSSSTKDSEIDHEKSSASLAAGCPRCLLYVLISKSNPLCPRCNCIVPLSVAVKKPRIDLNISG